jgi:hypothetical protein
VINLLYCESNEQYELKMTTEDLRSDKQLSPYFDHPIELFEELSYTFDDVNLAEKGLVQFKFNLSLKSSKTVAICLKTFPVAASLSEGSNSVLLARIAELETKSTKEN